MCVCVFVRVCVVNVCVCARVTLCVCVFSERGQGDVSVERARKGGGKEDNDTWSVDTPFYRPGTLVWTCFSAVSYGIF